MDCWIIIVIFAYRKKKGQAMLHIANPIYDIVFKYLMEDERIVKTILSALLKKEVVEAEIRKHEYTNGRRDKISMFRIDFGAKVREADGSIHLVLIELQKTWLETETLRFRQYLGAQYANPENMIKEDDPMGYGIPMVTVYLLGHKVGDIEVPVLYVKHKSYDYDGNEVTKGLPDPFVESLVHDSIIVQIPRLQGNVNNRLEEVLSVFDQTRKDRHNRQVMNIDEAEYAGDEEMMHIIHRLLAAAADAKLRQDMNVEDEYFLAIENRDTAIMQRDERIKEQDKQIADQGKQIADQGKQIADQDKQIADQGKQIADQGKQIADQDKQIADQGKQIADQGKQIADQGKQIAEQSDIIISSAKLMKESGMALEQIATITRLPIDTLTKL